MPVKKRRFRVEELRRTLRGRSVEEQLKNLQHRDYRSPFKYKDPGLKTKEDLVEQVLWCWSNVWKDLEPIDMPRPSWWPLYCMAKANHAEFFRDFVKPFIINQNAQKLVKDKKADEVLTDVDNLEGILNGSL